MADLHLGEAVDPAAHKRNGSAITISSGDFTTHGVIVGMTGSGKTGLGIVLIEEALAAGVPCILIDPKGDLTNLCLTFPNLAASDFRPWINDGDAQKAGLSPDDFAAAQAKTWTDGLAGWNLGPADIKALRDKAAFTIYTPGSGAGVPINIVGSLQAPPTGSDPETTADEIEGFVSGLLGLIGIDADPLSSREHILISNLIQNSWNGGKSLDLATLVGQVQSPPLRKLGVFDLESFYPAKDRTALAMKLNGLLASPAFAAWANGPALDIDDLLHGDGGKPRAAIITVSHLSDQERQFVVALVLSKLVTWMRRQSGTTDLRALVYMDEVAGYLPPTAAPPTKKPIMTLMKQARAFGVGMVLSTQNPVDIDYKAISNAGTWMIGHLQTERDKDRLLEGMSAASGGVDIKDVGDTISALGKREFVLRRAGKDKPEVFTSRWAMSYLRGPLTRDQIGQAMSAGLATPAPAGSDTPAPTSVAGAPAAASTGADAGAAPAATTGNDDLTPVMPVVAQGVGVRWADPSAPWLPTFTGNTSGTAFYASAFARVKLRYDDEKADLVEDQEYEAVLVPLDASSDPSTLVPIDYDDRDLGTDAPAGATYELPEASVKDKAYWTKLQRDIVDELVRNKAMQVFANKQLKLFSRVGETQDQFAQRCLQAAHDGADAEAAKLRDKYEAKAKTLQDQLSQAQDRASVIEEQRKSNRTSEILSTAGSILGSFLGGRRNASSIAGKVLSGLGGASSRHGRTAVAGERLDAAQDKVGQIQQDLQGVEDELTKEVTDITDRWNGLAGQIDTVDITLEKTDVDVAQLVLVWLPR
jgi:hypothetical protein